MPRVRKYHTSGKALKGLIKKYGAGGSVGGWGAVIGGLVGGAVGYFAKKGTKIKKSLYDNGGIFKALREKELAKKKRGLILRSIR